MCAGWWTDGEEGKASPGKSLPGRNISTKSYRSLIRRNAWTVIASQNPPENARRQSALYSAAVLMLFSVQSVSAFIMRIGERLARRRELNAG